WNHTPVAERAASLRRGADAMQQQLPRLCALLVKEARKTWGDSVSEVREAIDFLRYYANEAERVMAPMALPGPTGESNTLRLEGRGAWVCISPWNFPLAIFTGQVAAALVAGNAVLAKPAEETPLIAAEAVRLLHEAGVPTDALHLVPGDGSIGAALVAAPQTAAVMFTGSTDVARLIQRQLATRLSPTGHPIPLIAETGGQNAMIVDSSALAEQVVADVIASAFDSAGQRCSALRVLCLQEEVADRTLTMLKGALAELRIGRTDALRVDIGPVITAEARDGITSHIDAMRALGRKVEQQALPPETAHGTFVAPTIIEIDSLADLDREIFGPVLHVLRFRRDRIDALVDAINATGYGLTFGLHTRLDETIARVTSRVKVGNIYVNRNVIGAIVGVQPFGGCGLSGTGPKAGGPLYLGRLVTTPPVSATRVTPLISPLNSFADWLDAQGEGDAATQVRRIGDRSALGLELTLPGPVGERNLYSLHPRGTMLLRPTTRAGLFRQMAAILATGNDALVQGMALPPGLPADVAARFAKPADTPVAAVLVDGEPDIVSAMVQAVADWPGRIVPVHAPGPDGYCLDWLMEEVSTSINTTAAGGNASLMMIG
ncbi:MAG: L-glutamate gamma-semialdehyde dehydrogenase, partial [Alphaproteobacteria bacterium]|nr:L-glutamate gamma-semialdehyde dehydrogenase [Alphaproteobacteria bacterium]